MKTNKPVILIGSLTRENCGAIPTVTKAFIQGLKKNYHFIPHYADRRYGETKTSNFNAINIYYFIKHLALWTYKLLIYRPDIAHYPITSYWNLEKSLIFLKVAKMFGCKTIGHLHGGAFINFWTSLISIRKKWASRQLGNLDAFVVLSNGWKEKITKTVSEVRGKTFVVNNPIDYEFEKAFSIIPNNRSGNKILSVGVMSKEKGLFDILKSLKNIRNGLETTATLVGPEREPNINKLCKEMIDTYSLQRIVKVAGAKWGRDKIELFRESDIFLFLSYVENLPLVVIEAACAGLAIITTPVGAVPDFFEHDKSAIFVEPGDIKGIANAIIELMTDENKRRRLGEAARKVFVSRLSRDKVMKSLDGVYRTVLSADCS